MMFHSVLSSRINALRWLNPLDMFLWLNLLRVKFLALGILVDGAPKRKGQILKISFIKLKMIKLKFPRSVERRNSEQWFVTTMRKRDTMFIFAPSLKRLDPFLMLLFMFLVVICLPTYILHELLI